MNSNSNKNQFEESATFRRLVSNIMNSFISINNHPWSVKNLKNIYKLSIQSIGMKKKKIW
jgi:hypothetical protein